MLLNVALKEWDLLIAALLSGRQALLLRKGGILESDNQFELEHPRFLFYPTFIHQDPRMVKAPFRAGMTSLREEPDFITIKGYGEVATIFEVPSREKLEALNDLYLWDAPLLDMRFAYRPEKPLYLVVVRAFRLPGKDDGIRIQNTLAYAGCKSWVTLDESIETHPATPAIPDAPFADLLTRVQNTFAQ